MQRFLTNWHRLMAIGQMGAGESADGYAAEQPRQLMAAIEANERIRDLAINPLMLKVKEIEAGDLRERSLMLPCA